MTERNFENVEMVWKSMKSEHIDMVWDSLSLSGVFFLIKIEEYIICPYEAPDSPSGVNDEEQEEIDKILSIYNDMMEDESNSKRLSKELFEKVYDVMDFKYHLSVLEEILKRYDYLNQIINFNEPDADGRFDVHNDIKYQMGYWLCVENGLPEGIDSDGYINYESE